MGDNNNQAMPPADGTGLASEVVRILQQNNVIMERDQQVLAQLGEALQGLTVRSAPVKGPSAPGRLGSGPKVKEPRPYDGDRSNGKLDDHIRDLENWVHFYEHRHHWTDEDEKVQQASTYLEGRMNRVFELQRHSIHTFPEYIAWLRETFKDHNEVLRLKEEWHACTQNERPVMDYAADLLYIAARIPIDSPWQIKEHFFRGLDLRIQTALLEHPEWDNADLNMFIGYADRMEAIERSKEYVHRRAGTNASRRAFAIQDEESDPEQLNALAGPPRRGGREKLFIDRKPRKDSREWNDWCRGHNACFTCGKTGHASRECLSKPREDRKSPTTTRKRPLKPFKKTDGSGKGRTRI